MRKKKYDKAWMGVFLMAAALMTGCGQTQEGSNLNEGAKVEASAEVQESAQTENTKAEKDDESAEASGQENTQGQEKGDALQNPDITASTPLTISYEAQYEEIPDEENEAQNRYTSYDQAQIVPNGEVNEQLVSNLKTYFDENETAFKAEIADEPKQSETLSYWNQRVDTQVVSIIRERYTSQGYDDALDIAPWHSVEQGVNFDVVTGKQLSLDDLTDSPQTFVENARAALKSQLQTNIYKAILKNTGTKEESVSSAFENTLKEGNFFLTPQGVGFLVNFPFDIEKATKYQYATYPQIINTALRVVIPYDELSGMKQEYVPKDIGMAYLMGTTTVKDLDGNESGETVLCDKYLNEDGYATSFTIQIGDAVFSSEDEKDNIWVTDGLSDYYYIVDIDAADGAMEIALTDTGFSDDLVTYFFRYADGNIQYMGHVFDLYGNGSCYLEGDGVVHARERISLLETRAVPVTYQLQKDGTLSFVQQDWYDLPPIEDAPEYNSHRILQSLVVYREPADDSKSESIQAENTDADIFDADNLVELTPKDGPVTFLATDNKEWVKLQTKDETVYYMHMLDFGTIDSAGAQLSAEEVFENLLLAD